MLFAKNQLLVLAACCLAVPGAAQTVYLPTAGATLQSKEKSGLELGKESALAIKIAAINEVGAGGYDLLAFDSRARTIRGTPFILPSWAVGEVWWGTATKPLAGVFKFDIAAHQLRALRQTGDSIILAPEKVQGFTLRPTGPDSKPEERHFERLPTALVPELPVAYAEALSKGPELKLLRFQKKTVLKGHADPSYSSNTPVDSYLSSAQYYLRWSDGTYVAVKPTKGSVLTAVAARHATLAAAELQDKTKARTDAELGALVQRLESAMPRK